MENQALEIIKTITSEKIRDRRLPTHVLDIEIGERYIGDYDRMHSELDQLLKSYVIVDGRTINYTTYTLTGL